MAAFSYQHPRFVLDSVFQLHTPIKKSAFLEDGNVGTACFSPFDQSEPLQEVPFDVRIHQSSCLDNSTRVPLHENEPSVIEKQNTDSSSMVIELESGDQITQKDSVPMEKRKTRDESVLDSAHSKDTRKGKGRQKQKNCNGSLKDAEEKKLKADKKNQKKVPEENPTGYVHVRARRGQATDSHSLAERVRREKISERMKLLQGLVPGCEKITGKALILDEIINYVQSLQNQVEFLSMKLAYVNPMLYGFGVELDAFMVKPEKLSSSPSSLPLVQQSNPTQPSAFADSTTIFTATNNYSLLENAATILLNQGQSSNGFSQDNGNLLWDVDDQRQSWFINQSGFNHSYKHLEI